MKPLGRTMAWLNLGLGVLVLGAGLALWRPELGQDITRLLPRDDPELQGLLEVNQRFGRLDTFAIDLQAHPEEGGTAEIVGQAAESLAFRLRGSGQFERVQARVVSAHRLESFESLQVKLPRLVRPGQLQSWADSLSSGELRRRLEQVRRALIEPSGPLLKNSLRRDPLGLGAEMLRGLAPPMGEGAAAEVREGRLFSADGRDLLMLAVPGFPASDAARGALLVAAAESARAAVLRGHRPGALSIHYAGGHIANLDNAGTIRTDIERSLTAISLGIALLGVFFFRRWRSILGMFLPAALGSAVGLLVCGLVWPEMSAVALGCGAALIGIAVDYGIHVLFQLDTAAESELVPRMGELAAPLALGAATTVAGLLCLCLSPIPGQRQMGLFAASGVLAAALAAWFLLPGLVGAGAQAARRPWLVRAITGLLQRAQRPGLGLLLVLAVLATVGTGSLRFEGDVSKLNHLSPRNRADNAHLLKVWGSFSSTSAVVRGSDLETALQANESLYVVLEQLASKGVLRGLRSLAALLPSQAAQQRAWQRYAGFWSGPHGHRILADFRREAAACGFSASAFAPFLASLAEPPPVLQPEDFDGSIFANLLEANLQRSSDETWLLSSFQLHDRSQLRAVRARLEQALPGVLVVDKRAFVERSAALVRTQLVRLGMFACLAVCACLWLSYRRIELALLAVLPVALSGLLTLGLLGLFAVPLNLMSSLFVVFVFGVGVDYSVFLVGAELRRYRGGRADGSSTWGSVSFCALTTLCGFASLSLAEHPALHSIGLTGLLGVGFSLLSASWLIPVLGRLLLPEGGRAGAPRLLSLLAAIWAYGYLAVVMACYALFLRPWAWLRWRQLPDRQAFCRRYSRWVNRILILRFPYPHARVVFHGLEPQTFERPAVIVCNHLSMFDVVLVQTLPVDAVMLVKPWVWKLPLMGAMARDGGFLLVEEGGSERLLEQARTALEQGLSVTVFPEGSRSPDGRMRRFRKGAFELAVQLQADVVPVLLTDTQAAIPRGAFWIGAFHSQVRVLPRLTASNFDYSQGSKHLADSVKRLLLSHEAADWRRAQQSQAFWRNLAVRYRYRGALDRRVARRLRADPLCRQIDRLLPLRGTIVQLGARDGLLAAIAAGQSLERSLQLLAVSAVCLAQLERALCGIRNLQLSGELPEELPEADALLLVDPPEEWTPERLLELAPRLLAALRPRGSLLWRAEATQARAFWEGSGLQASDGPAGVRIFRRVD